MVDIDSLAHIRAESARFATALAGADPAAHVPSCPDWTAADLLWHLGEVQFFWATVIRERLTDPDGYSAPERPADYAALQAFFGRCTAELVAALERAEDDTPVWTWWPTDQSVGFIRRRQVHEAAIHRLDAELVSGPWTPLDPAMATDGIDQALHVDLAWVPEWAQRTPGTSIGLVQATDTDQSWLISVTGWGGTSPATGKVWEERTVSVVEAGQASEASYTVAAPAGPLDAWLWNRAPVGAVTVSGDLAAFDELQTVVAANGQ
jgi:uncharacterized protein (TIGR03083 family)